MQFVNLRKLKSQLRAGDLPPREVALYLAGQAALGVMLFVPSPADVPRAWDYFALPVLALVGVFYGYRCNGAAAGVRFAERYLALSWVIGWRTSLLAAAVIAVGFVAGLVTGDFAWLEDERVPVTLSATTALFIAFIYWRIGVHLQDVSADVRLGAGPQM